MKLSIILGIIISAAEPVNASSFEGLLDAKWTDSGNCALFLKDSDTQVRKINDELCSSEGFDAYGEAKWATDGRCAIYRGSTFVKGISEMHCSAQLFERLFSYQWSQNLTCQLMYQKNKLRQVEEHYCGDLPETHDYQWTTGGKCGVYQLNSASEQNHALRIVPDIYCGEPPSNFSLSWSKGGDCNLYRKLGNDELQFVSKAGDWQCGSLHPDFEYAWSVGGKCNLYDSDKFVREVPMSLCGDPSSNFNYSWTPAGRCGAYRQPDLILKHDDASLHFCSKSEDFTHAWKTDGYCYAIKTNGQFEAKVSEQLCPGFPVKKTYFLDEMKHCHLWKEYDGDSNRRYVSMVQDDHCQGITEEMSVPSQNKYYSKLRLKNPAAFEKALSYSSRVGDNDAVLNILLHTSTRQQTFGYEYPRTSNGSGRSSNVSGGSSGGRSGRSSRGYEYPSSVTGSGGSSYSHTGGGVYYDPSNGTSFRMPENGSGSTSDTMGRPINCSNGVCYRQ